MEYNITYKDSFENGEDTEIVSNWVLHDPITVKKVTGLVDDETTDLKIEMSNGDLVEMYAYHEISPRPIKGRSILTINSVTHNVEDQFLDLLEENGHVVLTVLQLYKQYV